MDPWYVYCLVSSGGGTYVGATVDPDRRLRQHSGILKGGARATAARVKAGETWRRIGLVGPFEKVEALQFEWRWKWLSKKQKGGAVARRAAALDVLINEKDDFSKTIIWDT